jgi:hypothetical protein
MSEPDRVTSITHVTDHVASGLALLPTQFRKPLIEALLTSWLVQLQSIEDASWQLLTDTLASAVGFQLDQLGQVLGLSRGTLTDFYFRQVLSALVLARRSRGTVEDLYAVMSWLFTGMLPSTMLEGAASVVIELHDPIQYDGAKALFVLKVAKAGGIALQLISPPVAESELFTFASSGLLAESDSARGFSDTAQLTGGQLTGVLA